MWSILALVPDEAFILVPVALGFMIMLRMISFSGAISILGGILLIVIISPFAASLLDQSPDWVVYGLLLLFGFSLLRWILQALVGKGAADHFVGSLIFALFLLPFQILGRLLVVLIGRRIP